MVFDKISKTNKIKMVNLSMNYNERLKELRIEKGLLQSDIAKIIDKSERTVGFYETGERDMNTETLAILADFFNCSIDYLLGKSDVRNPEKININDADVAFASGVKALNETNKMIIKNTLEALLAKQEQDNKNTEDK